MSHHSVEGGGFKLVPLDHLSDAIKPAVVVVLVAVLIGIYANALRIIHADDA